LLVHTVYLSIRKKVSETYISQGIFILTDYCIYILYRLVRNREFVVYIPYRLEIIMAAMSGFLVIGEKKDGLYNLLILFPRRMKLKKELRAVKEINEQERKKREDGRSDGESAIFHL
jgi:hypothetical protein